MKTIISVILLISAAISFIALADTMDTIQSTDSNARYVLKADGSATKISATPPTSVLFQCYIDDKLLGYTSFLFRDSTKPETLAIWTPILKRLERGEIVMLEIQGGSFSYTLPPKDRNATFWTAALPPPGKDANIRLLPKDTGMP
jgi:hypothetical protein